MSKFWGDYPDIAEELKSIQKIIKNNVKSSEKKFDEAISPLVDAGGKMLRPAFLLLAAKFGEYNCDKMYNLAAAIEMMHMATLVHDDIVDESKLRRGTETIQHKYSKEYAVYIGDFLFCQCFIMLSGFDYSTENLRDISKAISKICIGEIRQYNIRYARNTSLKKYIKIISGKTAALFAISFYTGAKESNCSEKTSKLLGRVGYYIGMAFQIIDDSLDYSGDANKLGKNPQSDLIKGYYTLPLIYAMVGDKENRIATILDNSSLSDEDVREITILVNKYKGIDKAQNLANKYTKKAFDYIEKLPDCESKEIIKDITQKLLTRNS
ncbi:polyprenyl synthetase family protein [Clostridium sp. CM028]|uniref:polyprenyl synthetase family protein n=1 Tax=unclassified Clostridium TaxID=2614128 RepID=UPI001C0BDED1|nr:MULTISPECIES: polyprenyl synthetase family protein [unclassified Clostridium]MBU3091982.1 polyprenyl synthetase family protein [Clostridium sp. CF011]MBW9145647.1 polyprenyl synthetase family protein [Clostridium sp. CM027]MBW9149497.1 polyprenyl synthetase family protein [Clostridium sp. CM028]UVE41500.1 polyprenyl synthetase family protein [Clostridium sp. CM027]WAG70497.1 polyprenyl synthetase family protein [Clostridium sp. CF011]